VSGANLIRLRGFVSDLAALIAVETSEDRLLDAGSELLRDLVRHDDWLPDAFSVPAGPYAQYLLHCDSAERFSVVSFVWSPGQGTPVHNHTVWGLVGMLRGAEVSRPFTKVDDRLVAGEPVRLAPGDVERVSPRIGDIHQVTNALADRPSVSIHVYGGNIGAVERSTFDEAGAPRRFVSGYSNASIPNLWNGVRPHRESHLG
jgi:predicted metal-dependent enzyme (double-stranded beta helix superfamily)